MLDLDAGGGAALGDEPDLHLGGVRPVAPQVPQIDQPRGRFPDRHLAPVVLDPVGCALVDPSSDATLQDDEVGLPGRGVVGRPLGADPVGPHVERVLG